VNNILHVFFAGLTEDERLYGVFQQDSATAHTAHASIETLQEVIKDHIISHGSWPSCSPDLTPCDFYSWGNLKDKVCETNPHTGMALHLTWGVKLRSQEKIETLLPNCNTNYGITLYPKQWGTHNINCTTYS
jgi:hypothetical protein